MVYSFSYLQSSKSVIDWSNLWSKEADTEIRRDLIKLANLFFWIYLFKECIKLKNKVRLIIM